MKKIIKRIATALFLGICALVLLALPIMLFMIFGLALLGYILLAEWPRFKAKKLTLLYPVLPWLMLLWLRYTDCTLFLMAIISAIATDSGAYFCGTFFGNHLLAPRISPKKSWEGLLGGIAASCLALGIAFGLYTTILLLGIAGGCAAIAGDLFESYLKRRAGIKDAGTILPGHGGILDRMDSILGTAILFFLIKSCFLK